MCKNTYNDRAKLLSAFFARLTLVELEQSVTDFTGSIELDQIPRPSDKRGSR